MSLNISNPQTDTLIPSLEFNSTKLNKDIYVCKCISNSLSALNFVFKFQEGIYRSHIITSIKANPSLIEIQKDGLIIYGDLSTVEHISISEFSISSKSG